MSWNTAVAGKCKPFQSLHRQDGSAAPQARIDLHLLAEGSVLPAGGSWGLQGRIGQGKVPQWGDSGQTGCQMQVM